MLVLATRGDAIYRAIVDRTASAAADLNSITRARIDDCLEFHVASHASVAAVIKITASDYAPRLDCGSLSDSRAITRVKTNFRRRDRGCVPIEYHEYRIFSSLR